MTATDRLSADANARVERWMLSQYRHAYRDDGCWFAPIGAVCAHLLRCPEAACGQVTGRDDDISEVTAGGMVELEAAVFCPHGMSDFYRYREQGDLAGVLEQLDHPELWEVDPVEEIPAYLHVGCSVSCGWQEKHRIHVGTTTVWARCEHPAYLTVVRDGVVVEERQIESGERYGVVLS